MRRESLLGRVVIAVWLVVMWVLLWGDLNLANVLGGVVLAVALVVVFPPAATNDDPIIVRPWAAISFLVWFLCALIVTNVAVAREVLLPSSRSQIRTAVVAVPLQTRSGRLATIIANAITLTPGTLTVDARGRPAVLYVHVLSFADVEGVLDEVADLERRVVRAFGTADEVARIVTTPPAPVEPEDAR
ncbi:MAG TPA: Na+/H+ antiporter subunit E [Iamia sp.]